jgi:hypothetical protein
LGDQRHSHGRLLQAAPQSLVCRGPRAPPSQPASRSQPHSSPPTPPATPPRTSENLPSHPAACEPARHSASVARKPPPEPHHTTRCARPRRLQRTRTQQSMIVTSTLFYAVHRGQPEAAVWIQQRAVTSLGTTIGYATYGPYHELNMFRHDRGAHTVTLGTPVIVAICVSLEVQRACADEHGAGRWETRDRPHVAEHQPLALHLHAPSQDSMAQEADEQCRAAYARIPCQIYETGSSSLSAFALSIANSVLHQRTQAHAH